ncbi:RNA-binding protein 39 [Trichinella pseudospiralis]|uniref:RNA-binding protein 39 n=1 Tax=Trichinella pseudospiralis TaxID=6337 RepID=A0A0V0XPG3_TRIPS|nr:RNA-binding protein 39 [Trichinella pseudospiralis]
MADDADVEAMLEETFAPIEDKVNTQACFIVINVFLVYFHRLCLVPSRGCCCDVNAGTLGVPFLKSIEDWHNNYKRCVQVENMQFKKEIEFLYLKPEEAKANKNKENGDLSDKKSRRSHRSGSREKKKKKKKSRSRSRSKNRSSRRDRSRSKHRRSRSRERRARHRSRERRDHRYPSSRGAWRSPPFRRSRSPPPYTRGGKPGEGLSSGKKLPGPERRDVMPFTPRYSPPRNYVDSELSPEERDARTVFCMQLARSIRPRDLEEFFSEVAKVRDVRIITDSKTRRSKGIAYVEFWDLDSVPLALSLHGKRLLGAPIVVQPTQSEKNRMASAMLATAFTQNRGPMKLYVGSLHFNITEEMLRGIFEPFGKIESIQLLKDPETSRSRGYGFITFYNSEDAKRAMEQLNGFELAGRPMKVGHVTEHQNSLFQPSLDSDELDRSGIDLGTTGRLQLMAKLAEGTGMELPQVAKQMLSAQPQQHQHTLPALQVQQQHKQQPQQQHEPQQHASQQLIATQCFMLSNMFNPMAESDPDWDREIRDDVIDECNKHQGVVHIFVDKASADGNVYVKCPTVAAAVAAVNSLHGRYFAGNVITANYVPTASYHQLFPDAVNAVELLLPSYNEK